MTDNKIVVITGASSGIGRTTALKYAKQGVTVVNADVRENPRKQEGKTPTHELIREQGGDAEFIQTDVTDWDAMKTMVDTVVDRYGEIDVFVNNAGFAENGPIEEMPLEDARKVFRINIDGVYHGMRAVVPVMKDQGHGTIINISSGAGKTGFAHLAAYCGSKFAVIGMTESVAKEVADHGITVNAVCPGRTKTAMTGFEGVPPENVAATIMDVEKADYTGRAVDV